MSFTYNNELTDLISQVRNMIGDTDENTADFSDQEIQWYLDQHNGDIYLAASEAAFRLYISFAKMAKLAAVDEIRIEMTQNAGHFKDIAKALKKMSAENRLRKSKAVPMYFGGQDKNAFNANREDMTLVPADFTKDGVYFDKDYPHRTPVRPTKKDVGDLYE